MSKQISDRPDRFKLWREPDGVYRVDGRVIPVADNSAKEISTVNDGKPVVSVKRLCDMGVGVLGRQPTVDVK